MEPVDSIVWFGDRSAETYHTTHRSFKHFFSAIDVSERAVLIFLWKRGVRFSPDVLQILSVIDFHSTLNQDIEMLRLAGVCCRQALSLYSNRVGLCPFANANCGALRRVYHQIILF